jgi:CBS domain-containing protein
MTAEPIAVSVQATVEEAFLLMAERGIHHLPVVEGERPIGMLGFRQAAQARPARLGLGF